MLSWALQSDGVQVGDVDGTTEQHALGSKATACRMRQTALLPRLHETCDYMVPTLASPSCLAARSHS